jgi:hypothetical protein
MSRIPHPGDTYRYKPSGSRPLFPPGQPVVVERVDNDSCVARFAYSITRFTIPISSLEPFPAKTTPSDAALEVLKIIKGNLASVHHDQMLIAYERLVRAGRIPEINESRVVRATP